MQERTLDTVMSRTDFDTFQAALEGGKEKVDGYIKQYILTHINLSHDDVLSMALIEAINYSPSSVSSILSVPHQSNILATVDGSGFSPISSLFFQYPDNKEVMEAIESYLQTAIFPKVDLKDDTFIYLHSALQGPIYDLMTVFDNVEHVSEHFLNYIYSERTLNQFKSAFVASFNPNDYEEQGHEAFFEKWQPHNFEEGHNQGVVAENAVAQKKTPMEAGLIEREKDKNLEAALKTSPSTSEDSQSSSSNGSSASSSGDSSGDKLEASRDNNTNSSTESLSNNNASGNVNNNVSGSDLTDDVEILGYFQEKISEISLELHYHDIEILHKNKEEEESDKAREKIEKNLEESYVAKARSLEDNEDKKDENEIDGSLSSGSLSTKPQLQDRVVLLPSSMILSDPLLINGAFLVGSIAYEYHNNLADEIF